MSGGPSSMTSVLAFTGLWQDDPTMMIGPKGKIQGKEAIQKITSS
jgi:hypothetical protein